MHPVEMPRFKKLPSKAITKRQSVDADESGVGFWRIYHSSVQKIVCNFWRTGRPHKLTPRRDYLMGKESLHLQSERQNVLGQQRLSDTQQRHISAEFWTNSQQAGVLKKWALNTQLKDGALAVRLCSADQGRLSETTTFTIKTYFPVYRWANAMRYDPYLTFEHCWHAAKWWTIENLNQASDIRYVSFI